MILKGLLHIHVPVHVVSTKATYYVNRTSGLHTLSLWSLSGSLNYNYSFLYFCILELPPKPAKTTLSKTGSYDDDYQKMRPGIDTPILPPKAQKPLREDELVITTGLKYLYITLTEDELVIIIKQY